MPTEVIWGDPDGTQFQLRRIRKQSRSADPLDLICVPTTAAINLGFNGLEWIVGRLVDRSAAMLAQWWQARLGRDGKERRR